VQLFINLSIHAFYYSFIESYFKLSTLARIICIDYGGKRCGLAVTDPLQIIATALTTVATKELYTYLAAYFAKEPVELILIGEPLNLDDTPTHATPLVKKAIVELGKKFPTIPIQTVDERFSSKNAVRAMVEMGMKKKDRQDKKNVDQIAATILLQEYLTNRP
jgi:putative Holliday junction resolvase